MDTVIGEGLPKVDALGIIEGMLTAPSNGHSWVLRGVTSYARYVHSDERQHLQQLQASLDRPQATCAALIPIKKSAAWWELPQDVRRAIFEEQSHHTAIGIGYMPAIARRLHHGYDLGEPFDFLTWFEYAPEDAPAFERLTQALRAAEEWRYVEREIDIRLIKY
jgi:chlorite dismutase